MTYHQCHEVLCKRQNWLKRRIKQANSEGRLLSHDIVEADALELAIELVEVAANGEKELTESFN